MANLLKHYDGGNLADLLNFKTVGAALIKINGKNHYRGVTPYPVTPNPGDTWEELNASGNWVESWFFNGTYWISEQEFTLEQTTNALSANGIVATYPLVADFNVFVTSMYASVLINVAANASNFWQWQINSLSNTGLQTTWATANNQGQAANTWASFSLLVNTLIAYNNPSRVAIRIVEGRAGTINKQGSTGFNYRKARL